MWRFGDGAPPTGAHAVLVPGAEAPLLALDLPEKLTGNARERVAMRLLAERLALPVSAFEMHPFRPGGEKRWTQVVLVDSQQARQWREDLPRGARAMLPDYLGLPTAPGLWTIEVRGDRMTARLGPKDGFGAETALGLVQLAEAPPPKSILRLGDPHGPMDAYLDGLSVPIHTDPAVLRRAGFSPLRWTDATGGVDLARPPTAAEDRLRAVVQRWRLATVASVAALAAWLGTVAMETKRAEQSARADRQQIETLVREHFVPAGPILDIRAQVSSALEDALRPDTVETAGVPPLTQFQIAAEYLTRPGVTLQSVSYRPETGLEAVVETTDFATLDRLAADLQGADFLVEQLDSRAEQSGGVVARLRLELPQ